MTLGRTAVAKFERLYAAAIRDGRIDGAEAKALVDLHNELQRLSRQELTARLRKYGDYESTERLNRTGIINHQASREVFDTSEYDPYGPLELSDVSRRSIGKKTKFFMITGIPIVVAALDLLGVF